MICIYSDVIFRRIYLVRANMVNMKFIADHITSENRLEQNREYTIIMVPRKVSEDLIIERYLWFKIEGGKITASFSSQLELFLFLFLFFLGGGGWGGAGGHEKIEINVHINTRLFIFYF